MPSTAKKRTPKARQDDYVPFYAPWTDARERRQVVDSVRSGWLTTGPKVAELERRACAYVESRHAVAVNSCTAAMHMALVAAGVSRGDEVVTSPYTFASTGEVILFVGARPVFADINPRTLNIDPEAARRAITRRTKAIMPVHMAGLSCEMKPIMALAREKRIRVIEDAAHAFGTRYGDRPIGSIGHMTCFSFYATKNLTTGEGGMVTTDDARVAERLRRLSLHGLTRDAWKRYSRAGSWRYDVVEMGFKYNMTDLAAGLGLAQFDKFETMQRKRERIVGRYQKHLKQFDVFDLPAEDPVGRHAWHLFILRVRPRMLRIGRDEVIEKLREMGIGTSVHFQPLHMFSFYRKTFGYKRGAFPFAERESARAISLPLFPTLKKRAQERVIDALGDLAKRYRR